MDMSNQILNEADKVIGNLMLEVNRLNNEILLKDKKINDLQEHNANLVDDLFAERKEVIKLEAEIEQLKALAISLSHRNANLQYTKVSEK